MPTTRTPLKRRNRRRITPAAVEQYRRCREIRAEGGDDAWERDGGRRREYLDAYTGLHRALGLKPWECSPLNATDGPAPPGGELWRQSWPQAQELRRQLEAAVA